MNKLQKEQLEIVMEVDRICKKHKINYLMDAGTMLGAVRHKGFIPWDDDLDICMLRKDYDKFSEIVDKELDGKYFYQTNKTDKNFGFFFAKIRKNNTLYLEEMAINNKSHSGIFIDIFPIDNNSDNKKIANILFKINLIFRMLLLIKCKYKISTDTLLKKLEYIILKICSIILPKKFIIFIGNKIQLKYKNRNIENVTSFSTTYFKKCVHEKNGILI